MRKLVCTLILVACGGGEPAVLDGGGDDGGGTDAHPPLEAHAGESRYALVGEPVTFDGSASVGATRYQWDFGNGEGQPAPSDLATATITYTAPGRYHAVLTVFNDAGERDSDGVTISVTHPPVFTPYQSGTIVPVRANGAAVVSTDTDEIVVLDLVSYPPPLWLATRLPACDAPVSVSARDDSLIVACPDDDLLRLVNRDGSSSQIVELPGGSRPAAALWGESGVIYVALQGAGALAILDRDLGPDYFVSSMIPGLPDARALAQLPDGRIAVTRWRSPDGRGVVSLVTPPVASGGPWTVEEVELAFDPQISSDTEIGGVPSFLDQFLVSPTGMEAAVPTLIANTADGMYRNGRPFSFQTLVRASVSHIDLATDLEVFDRRRQFDNRGRASGAAWSPLGDYLYVAMPGSRALARVDALADEQAGSLLDVGWATRGIAASSDGSYLFVDAWLSREVVIYDSTSFTTNAPPIARVTTVGVEPLNFNILRGKRLFNDSFDTRLSRDGYVACSVCHPDGDEDLLVWDQTQLGEGLRNTISLIGRAGAGDGPIHWTGNFDEIQDFEHPIRELFEGSGLMADADFHTGTRDQPLGDSKAGVSPDLDALTGYVTTLYLPRRSPYRAPGGELTPAAAQGQMIFESGQAGCTTCHVGPRFTDSAFLAPGVPNLHDVGTLGPGSGSRLGGPLTGIDTPTLMGLWGSAPYLHDGSAPTLLDVLTTRNPGDTHGTTSHLTAAQLDYLVAYLLSL